MHVTYLIKRTWCMMSVKFTTCGETGKVPAIPMTGAQVLADLTERISKGEYPPGSKLPSAREVAELYRISISTAQRIFTLLQERGLAVGQQGRGVYVAERPRKRQP